MGEAFYNLGSDVIMNELQAHQEPIFKAMDRVFASTNATNFTAATLRSMIARRNQLQKDYLDKWMATKTSTAGPIDGIIAPVAPLATPRLGFAEKTGYLGYTAFVNILGKASIFLRSYIKPEADHWTQTYLRAHSPSPSPKSH